jgi:hypothetical protein
MTNDVKRFVGWTGPIAILLVHAMALGLLFLLIVVVGHAFYDHYKATGIPSTPRFDMVNRAADFLARYSAAYFVVLAVDALLIRGIMKKPARWLTTYSHVCLGTIVVAMFIAITWMINPMAINAAKGGVAPANQAVASAR